MTPLLFVLLCLGISYGISTEMVTLPMREWVFKHAPKFFSDLIYCNVCTSFWVGTIMGLFFTPGLFFIFDGFIVMSAMKIIDKISNKDESNI